MNKLKEFWYSWGAIIVLVSILVGIFYGIYLLDHYSCLAKTAEIGFPAKHNLMSGCRIFVENRWIPLDNWYFKTP